MSITFTSVYYLIIEIFDVSKPHDFLRVESVVSEVAGFSIGVGDIVFGVVVGNT